ncbi:flavodoxin FldA [Buchnera aphidicola (Thelaxes californica)]|uniref:Flavodoxin n=1 Tax=Buchnera aphidicola (Thelaxes californica) TaxID=1315998 RepID=A0A4D6YFA9_9GAMM|nr:flavodoxin FldA [Buchnera aphidicola]QCI26763.1 flavodoxin FldA [Buchnera aphidicola (Thelaxes californica)]
MKKIGIFFGTDTGNTENIANIIKKKLSNYDIKIFDISNATIKDIEQYQNIIFGIPTWYYGEIQCDWNDFIPNLKKINFKGKKIALFGCGDQEDYSEYFCDALYYIYKIIKKRKGECVGKWSTSGYNFTASKSLLNEKYFLGLIIDEDRQPEQTLKRVNKWVEQIIVEFR